MNTVLGYLDLMIDDDMPVAPYQQLAAILRQRIADGEIKGRLPSERALMQEFGLAQGTIRRALDMLVKEGLITKVHGLGSFVRQGPRS
jgi:DNA-binding GntR family transcriptional regulator